MNWNYYNIHYRLASTGLRYKVCMTALDKEDAKSNFENYARVDIQNAHHIPFEAEVIKVIGPLGMHKRTKKQNLAGHYRWILGNISSAQATLSRIHTDAIIASGRKAVACENDFMMVYSNIAKIKRDVREIFIKAGINIK